jgi:FixJ family two-component response regulator
MDADTFTSGQDFIELLKAMSGPRIECVVLDVQMPGMSGLEIQERLKTSGSGIPVIFITAHDEMGARKQAMANGAVAFLRKPFNDELFIVTLEEALKRSTTAKQEV